MLYELGQYADAFKPFNLFNYTTFRTGGALLTALLFGLIVGLPFISWLREKQGKGQPIRQDDFLERHVIEKAGTPTMGGLLILMCVLASTLLWADLSNAYVWIVLMVTAGFGVIGFLDDFAKVTKQSHAGLSGRVRLLAEFLIAGAAVFFISMLHGGVVDAGQAQVMAAQEDVAAANVLVLEAETAQAQRDAMAVFTAAERSLVEAQEAAPPAHFATGLALPFFKNVFIPLTIFGFVLFGAVVIVGAGNAVNMTDGLDGLAIVPVMIAAASFGFIAYIVGTPTYADYLFLTPTPGTTELAVLIGALFGAGLAFLWYNAPPAMVFMGDTGSLSLGGALGAIAVAVKHEIVLAIIGGLFVLEAMSVIIQVGYFKLTGKRVFLMAPIHHHFEKMGWKESTVVVRFWIVAVVLAIIGLATLKLR